MAESHRLAEKEEILTLPDDGSRPTVDGNRNHKFFPGDEVLVIDPQTQQTDGPFLIEEAEDGRYKLCDEAANTVENGKWFEESELISYDPFA